MKQRRTDDVYVWDPFIRIFHWLVAVAFTVAYLTEDDVLSLHVWAGYLIGALVVLRVIWGFVGPEHARFGNFLYRPKTTIGYVASLLTFRSTRYLGHSPGGGAMVVVVLVSLAVTVASGIVVYGDKEGAGPLAGLFSSAAVEPGQVAATRSDSKREAHEDEEDERESGRREGPLGEAMEELHEFFANVTLALVLVHIAAVLLASFVNRENLTKAMITGYKRR